jgi:hypothetical protein
MMILFCPGGGESNNGFPGRLPLSSISPYDEPARQSVWSAARHCTSPQS